MCGVVAIYCRDEKLGAAPLVREALLALQHRGQEAAGIVAVDTKNGTPAVHVLRGPGLITAALPAFAVARLVGQRAVGHTRYSTVPIDSPENLQPFVGQTPFGPLAICHNGNLKNAAELSRELVKNGVTLRTTLDTELFWQLLLRAPGPDFVTALGQAAGRIKGAYSLTISVGERLFGLRDPHGLRPLCIGTFSDDKGLVIASETCALETIGATYLRDVLPGELVEIGPQGITSTALLPAAKKAPCVFELVYFARPDSRVYGQDVTAARLRMGEELALQDAREGSPRADVVVPVPRSGVLAAMGYAKKSGIPLGEAIVLNADAGPVRAFLLPDPKARPPAVTEKLLVVKAKVAGKRVLLVDDSLVRGHTAKRLSELLHEAGAKEIFLRIASPPIAWPCDLGIDMPDPFELVMNQKGSAEAVARHVGVESLRYLDRAGLRRAIGGSDFCMACMDSKYPV